MITDRMPSTEARRSCMHVRDTGLTVPLPPNLPPTCPSKQPKGAQAKAAARPLPCWRTPALLRRRQWCRDGSSVVRSNSMVDSQSAHKGVTHAHRTGETHNTRPAAHRRSRPPSPPRSRPSPASAPPTTDHHNRDHNHQHEHDNHCHQQLRHNQYDHHNHRRHSITTTTSTTTVTNTTS